MKIGITNLIERDGITLRHEARTNGGELAGPCPFCGGNDRFRVWPQEDRYWCRQCGGRGDSIQYLRDKHGMTYPEACGALGIEPSLSAKQETAATPPKPPADEWLSVEWQKAAWAFLERCRGDLQRSSGSIAYLKGRGLNDETIALLGLNARTTHVDRDAWGLLPETDAKTGKLKRLWFPRGIVIPALDGSLVHRLRIRLHPDEFERSKAWTKDRGIRYAEVSGSGNDPLSLPGGDGAKAWAVVESELDAYLVHQEAGDLVNVLGLGSITGRPTAGMLKDMAGATVLLCLDHDSAGWKALDGLTGEYWPVPDGKDPGEYFLTGGSIRSWIELGLKPDIPLGEIVQPEPLQEAEEPVQDNTPGEIEKGEALSLPCNKPGFRCYHLRGGHCFYKSNWGPVADMGACPMVYGMGAGYAHPEIERLEKQRQRVDRAMKTCPLPDGDDHYNAAMAEREKLAWGK